MWVVIISGVVGVAVGFGISYWLIRSAFKDMMP
jgi:type IV secretory pathway TrbD component